MKAQNYLAVAERAMEIIQKGAFLTVRNGDGLNTMTIGWAAVGFMWRKPIFTVMVRDSRYTFTLIEKAADFTVSVPTTNMHEQVMYCGTKSGRDIDKFKALDLSIREAQQTISPIIDIPGIHFECRIVYRSAMDPGRLEPDDNRALYPKRDYHTLYYGEIVSCYETQ